MSNLRYLEITSNTRNRNLYQHPGTFEVLISQTGRKGKIDAYDPVSNSAPINEWCPVSMVGNPAGPGTGVVSSNTNNSVSKILMTFPINLMNTIHTPDYYTGLSITIGGINTLVTSSTFESTQSGYDSFWINISPSLTSVPASGTVVTSLNTVNTVNGTIWVPTGNYADNYFANDYIIWNDSLQQYAKILSFDGSTHTIGVDSSLIAGWLQTHNLVIRRSLPELLGSTVVGPVIQNTVYLDASSSSVDSFYTGDFIRFPPQVPGSDQGLVFRVSSYSGSSKKATLTPLYPSTVVPAILVGSPYEILNFTRDNVYPFVYTGSTVSQQEMTCYEIQLTNLILPNRTLINGGRTAFYPYVYVELQNLSGASGGISNIIYSNNPTATKMLFRATIDDIRDPIISPFIRIDGDGMKQTVKFKPNDNLKFSVYLPNGELFETLQPETYSPAPPNPFVQLSALFAIKKL